MRPTLSLRCFPSVALKHIFLHSFHGASPTAAIYTSIPLNRSSSFTHFMMPRRPLNVLHPPQTDLLPSLISRLLADRCLFYTPLKQIFFLHSFPRSGELRTQKLKSHLVRTQSLNILPLKLGVGQYMAMYATLTARDFFLAYFYPSGPFTCIFTKTSRDFFFLCWLWLRPVSV